LLDTRVEFGRHEEAGAMLTLTKYPRIKPGRTWTSPRLVLGAYSGGGWLPAAGRFRHWWYSRARTPRIPEWLKSIGRLTLTGSFYDEDALELNAADLQRHRDEKNVSDNVANGQFCARHHDGGGWSPSYLAHDGHSCFTVDSAFRQPDDALVLACKTAPSDADLDIAFLSRPRSELQPLEEYPKQLWSGWQAIYLGLAGHPDGGNVVRVKLTDDAAYQHRSQGEGEVQEVFFKCADLTGQDLHFCPTPPLCLY